MSRSGVQEVVAYVWRLPRADREEGGECWTKVPALDFWDGSTTKDGNKSYIVIAEQYRQCRLPDAEELACGHRQMIRTDRSGGQIYNRRRVCKQCAACYLRSDTLVAFDPWTGKLSAIR